MKHFIFIIATLLLFSCNETPSLNPKQELEKATVTNETLRQEIQEIITNKKAEIGLAIIGPDGDTLSINGDKHFSMMSVAKFPQALALLQMVDNGQMKVDEPLHFTEADLKQRTYSTLTKDHLQREFDLSIAEALAYSIGQSDNITSNVIFAREGGPKAVEAYVQGLGISDIGVEVDYWHLNNETAPSNWTTPKAMSLLLQKYFKKELLREETHGILWNAMINGPSGAKRLKYLLPAGTVVAHKTGTGNTDDATGKIHALNDVGIVVLPNGKPLIIAVFTANSLEAEEITESVIAQIGKAAYEFYTKR